MTARNTMYLPEDECFKEYDGRNVFMKYTCTSAGAVGKYYTDSACATACTASDCSDNNFPIDSCSSSNGHWIKASCGTGSAIRLSRELFSDSGCTTATGNQTMYINPNCTEVSDFNNGAWVPKSRKVIVSATTLSMDEYGSTDCTGTIVNPSNAACNMCLPDGSGVYHKMSTDTCVGGAIVSSGTWASPLAPLAIAAVAFLAQ